MTQEPNYSSWPFESAEGHALALLRCAVFGTLVLVETEFVPEETLPAAPSDVVATLDQILNQTALVKITSQPPDSRPILALHLLALTRRGRDQLRFGLSESVHEATSDGMEIGFLVGRLLTHGILAKASAYIAKIEPLAIRQQKAEISFASGRQTGAENNLKKGDPVRQAARLIIEREKYRSGLTPSSVAREIGGQFPDKELSGIRKRIMPLFERLDLVNHYRPIRPKSGH